LLGLNVSKMCLCTYENIPLLMLKATVFNRIFVPFNLYWKWKVWCNLTRDCSQALSCHASHQTRPRFRAWRAASTSTWLRSSFINTSTPWSSSRSIHSRRNCTTDFNITPTESFKSLKFVLVSFNRYMMMKKYFYSIFGLGYSFWWYNNFLKSNNIKWRLFWTWRFFMNFAFGCFLFNSKRYPGTGRDSTQKIISCQIWLFFIVASVLLKFVTYVNKWHAINGLLNWYFKYVLWV